MPQAWSPQVAPGIALMIFLALPILHAVTSHRLYELAFAVRRRPTGRHHPTRGPSAKRPGEPATKREMSWPAYEKIAVRRAPSA